MSSEKALEKVITVMAKLSIPDCIELHEKVGGWLHSRITEFQEKRAAENKELEIAKEKLKQKP